jgi:hypothetical protein
MQKNILISPGQTLCLYSGVCSSSCIWAIWCFGGLFLRIVWETQLLRMTLFCVVSKIIFSILPEIHELCSNRFNEFNTLFQSQISLFHFNRTKKILLANSWRRDKSNRWIALEMLWKLITTCQSLKFFLVFSFLIILIYIFWKLINWNLCFLYK